MIYLFVIDDSFTSLKPVKARQLLCVTDRSKSILLWWLFLFNALVLKIFCAVGALCMLSYF